MWIHPNPRDLPAYHEALVAHLRHEIHRDRGRADERRAVRRWVGRQLVRVGTRLAADPTMRPIRSP
jgi:hypothetical protein